MNDVASIKKSLQFDKHLWKLHNVEDCINSCLAQLWGGEGVTNAFVCPVDDSQCYILVLTNKCRIIKTSESKYEVKGFLIDRTNYDYNAVALDVTGIDPNKVRCVEQSSGGWLSKSSYHVIIDGIGTYPIDLNMDDKKKAFAVRDAIVEMANNASKTISNAAHSSESNAAIKNGATSDKAASIKEFRDMFEQGIITKEEMLELIKSLN